MVQLKDHELRELVNDLARVAKTYGQSQQVRERLSEVVQRHLKLGPHAPRLVKIAPSCVGKACSCPANTCAEAGTHPDDVVEVLQSSREPLRLFKEDEGKARQSLHEKLVEIRRSQRPSQALLNMIVGGPRRHKDDDTCCGK